MSNKNTTYNHDMTTNYNNKTYAKDITSTNHSPHIIGNHKTIKPHMWNIVTLMGTNS